MNLFEEIANALGDTGVSTRMIVQTVMDCAKDPSRPLRDAVCEIMECQKEIERLSKEMDDIDKVIKEQTAETQRLKEIVESL